MTKRMVMAILALVGLMIGIYLTLYKYGVIGALSCSVGSCETVQTSKWSMFIGLPVAAWGAGYYALVLTLTMAGVQPRFADSRPLALGVAVLTGWGMLFSAWLTYLEWRVINAWCQWCVISAVLATLLFVLAALDWRDTRRWGHEAVGQ
jgi:uncharacterized membrane protein